jgi:hypothetical protein
VLPPNTNRHTTKYLLKTKANVKQDCKSIEVNVDAVPREKLSIQLYYSKFILLWKDGSSTVTRIHKPHRQHFTLHHKEKHCRTHRERTGHGLLWYREPHYSMDGFNQV